MYNWFHHLESAARRQRSWISLLTILTCILYLGTMRADDLPPVYMGLDGEFGLLNSTSAQAIEKGIQLALDEINTAGGVLGGRPLVLLSRDNRSVPARGVDNIRQFAQIPDLVAVVAGRFSPVILEELPVIHELHMILLDAWASADGVTEHEYHPSYTFRLSLKDRWAMPVMLAYAQSRGMQRVGLLLPNTGWGRSNLNAAERHHANTNIPNLIGPVWYNWGETDMLRHYHALVWAGAQAIILVANDLEGGRLVRQLGQLNADEQRPLISHWGVNGGRMLENSGEALFQIDFSVLQTFNLLQLAPLVREHLLTRTRRLFDWTRIEDITAPAGFAQAYDLTHLLARAIALARTTERTAVRNALEQVENYHGLTGVYLHPFTSECHDALDPEQIFIGRFRRDGLIVPIAAAPVTH